MKTPEESLRDSLAQDGVLDEQQVKQQATAATASPETAKALVKKKEAGPDPRKLEPTYTFDFSYTNKRGKKFEGELTNEILGIKEQRLAGILRAQLNGGIPVEALDDKTNDLNFVTAHLMHSLKKPLPDWLNFDTMKHADVIFAIWKEVDSHEKTFHGSGETP